MNPMTLAMHIFISSLDTFFLLSGLRKKRHSHSEEQTKTTQPAHGGVNVTDHNNVTHTQCRHLASLL